MSGALLGAVSPGIRWGILVLGVYITYKLLDIADLTVDGSFALGIMVLGVYITYKLLDIADLTVDGSFALGGSVCAVLVVAGVDPLIAVEAALLAGMLAGAVTGFLHTVFESPAILAGILTQIALWSVNLRIMGKSNTPLLQSDTIFSRMTELTGLSSAGDSRGHPHPNRPVVGQPAHHGQVQHAPAAKRYDLLSHDRVDGSVLGHRFHHRGSHRGRCDHRRAVLVLRHRDRQRPACNRQQ